MEENKLMKNCYKAADKTLTILEELGYTSPRKPSYENELRDLMALEIWKNIRIFEDEVIPKVPDDSEITFQNRFGDDNWATKVVSDINLENLKNIESIQNRKE